MVTVVQQYNRGFATVELVEADTLDALLKWGNGIAQQVLDCGWVSTPSKYHNGKFRGVWESFTGND